MSDERIENEDDNLLTQYKWVRVMADIYADGVWDKEGCACSVQDLAISEKLIRRITKWQDWYNNIEWPYNETSNINFKNNRAMIQELKDFALEGFRIACELKRQLPCYCVIYHDEEKGTQSDKNTPRHLYEYEITYEHLLALSSDRVQYD